MNALKVPFVLAMTLLGSTAWAQTVPAGPIADLESQVATLNARVGALEAAAPSSSVEGRTYCFVLDLTMMRGIGVNQTEHLVKSIIRRTATFEGGLFQGNLVSHVRNTQTDDGIVAPTLESSPDPLYGTYTQNGNRLDMVFQNGGAASWYVSKDGSMISGTSQSFIDVGGLGQVTSGQTRHWTLVDNDSC